MKALVCEMCESNDIVKQDGFFVCQHCGMKYSAEEAKKMMIEGTVDVTGSVKLDRSDELEKLYQAARNAREVSDDEGALKHYENISAKDPNSWEALFYSVMLKTSSIKNSEISSAAISISKSLPKVFQLVKEYVEDVNEQKKVVEEIINECYTTAVWLTNASHEFYKMMTKGNGMIALTGITGALSSMNSTGEALNEDQNRCMNIANIMCYCGNYIEHYFDMNDEDFKTFAVWSWKQMLQFYYDYKKIHNGDIFDNESLLKFSTKINQYDSSYEIADKQSGCYVATAVYGSYDCPEVWTLRRFRDYTLAESWYGRAFIRCYYAVSPTLVKWFGKNAWFKRMWRGKLDRMVERLQNEGFESTPYTDRNW